MNKPILAIDVGSSYVKFGFFRGEEIISVDQVKKESLQEYLGTYQKAWNGVKSVISSVTPSLHPLLVEGLQVQTGIKPYFLNFQDILNLSLSVKEPRTVGIDRILNCVAGMHRYKGNLIILDLGTATTIDVVTDKQQFIGGMILPGVDTFKNSLFQNTEQLSGHQKSILEQVTLPQHYLGQNTFEAINAGVVGGYFSMLEGLLEKLQGELSGQYQILATGGATSRLDISTLVTEIQPNLSLEGIKIAFNLLEKS